MPPSTNRRKTRRSRDATGEVSHQAMIAADPSPKKIPSRFHVMDIPGTDFYAYLNAKVVEEIGPPEEGFQRTINFQTVPERGVVELTVVDSFPEEIKQ